MIFLNSAVLVGLAAIAIPIIIHLIHRRKANVLNWGAMQFLRASVAARQRRTIIEELILMVLRCLLIAMLVMAVARPFVPADSRLPWAVVLPLCLAGAVCAAVAAVVRAKPLLRWGIAAAAVILVGSSGLLAAHEMVRQGGRWSGTGGQDVAVVIDSSASMYYSGDGGSNFDLALDEARALVGACRPDDTLTLVLADAAPRDVIVGPTADHGLVAAALDTLRPNGGMARVLPALDLAASALAEGPNAAKKIVFVTDGQEVGWNARSEPRWQFLAGSFAQLPTQPELICRTLELPDEYVNLSVAAIQPSRRLIGTDRPVAIDVVVANHGTRTSPPCTVELQVDDGQPARKNIGAVEPGSAETVRFRHRFAEPGRRALTAGVLADDDLPVDDVREVVVGVTDALPVLIADGEPSARPLDSVADFVALALAPVADVSDSLIRPRVVPLTEIAAHRDFGEYRLVILANCSRLPSVQSAALAVFVRNGGGLLIAAGERCDPEFYDTWMAGDQGPVVPARLVEFRRDLDEPARLGLETFAHPALAVLADRDSSDADAALFDRYWSVEADQTDPAVRTAVRLESGEPCIVERNVGKGFVILAAAPLGRAGGNLPTLKCYVPLLHELAYYLAAPTADQPTVEPGTAVAIEPPADGGALDVVMPDGTRVPLGSVDSRGFRMFGDTAAPGVYRIVDAAEESPEGGPDYTAMGGGPFAVKWAAEESLLARLSAEDLESIRAHVPLFVAQTTGEMTAALTGEIPGQEVWKQLAACALLALLAEVLVARWITVQRRSHAPSELTFGSTGPQPGDLRARLARPAAAAVEAEEANT